MTPRKVERVYHYNGIDVGVRIDFITQQVSLIEIHERTTPEKETPAKKWVFTNRGMEYLGAWRLILKAMDYAIEQAALELEEYQKEKERREVERLANDF